MNRSDIIKSYVPLELREEEPLKSIYESEGIETGNLFTNNDDVLNQFYVETATWGLDLWEQMLGLPITPLQATDERRSKIISKLRGIGTVTVEMIQNVSEAYSNGTVSVIEDNTNYKFTIKFISALGIPPNLTDLKDAIERIKPAHLEVAYEFTYNTYSTVGTKTHVQLSVLTHEQIRSTTL